MKELFKKRLKKLTAFIVALVMMLLPGQSLLVMAAETYKAEEIVTYYVDSSTDPYLHFYNKILKPGDTITNSDKASLELFYYYNGSSSTDSNLNTFVIKDFMSSLEETDDSSGENPMELYSFLEPFFKGWEVSWASQSSNVRSIGLTPILQYAHVDDLEVSNTATKVTFQAKLPEIPDGLKESNIFIGDFDFYWGYATPVTDEYVKKHREGNTFFINPDDNQLYQFDRIIKDDNYETNDTLTLSLEDAKKGKVVFAMTPNIAALALNSKQEYYFSNLAQVKINYAVSYVKPDGTKLFKDDTGNSLEEFKITKTPSVDGYTFEGWYDNANCTGTKITSIPKGNEKNVTLYAKLNKKPATQPSTDTQATISKETYEKNSTTMTLSGKLTWKGKKLVINWGAVPGADGYDIIATRCGKAKMTNDLLVKTVPAGTTKAVLSKIDGKKLNLIKSYKVQVKAFKGSGESKQYIGESMVYHSAGKNSPFTNAKKVTLNKKKITLKVGKTFKLSPTTIKQDKNKKLLSANHAPLYRYLSSDTSVATVNKNGKIKAVGKGSCKVYAIAINGFKTSIKVTVK